MLTPGAYLKYRRTAARLSVADVAAAVATVPRVAEHIRAEWLELIEADAMPASFSTIVALRGVYEFDLEVLERIVRIGLGIDLPPPRLCRICACSQDDPCVSTHGLTCSWITADLCSACALPAAPIAAGIAA